MSEWFKKPFLILIRGYQLFLSPVIGSNCRYYPTCSCYAHQAIEKHGVFRGLWLGIRRVGRCHPWAEGGYDPVPGTGQEHDLQKKKSAK